MCARTIILFSSILFVSQCCYWNSHNPYIWFCSKTVYDDVRGDIRDAPEIAGCEPVSVWALVRHGTRRPTSANVLTMKAAAGFKDEILGAHRRGLGQLCAQDLENLQQWEWDNNIDGTAGQLTEQGYQELYKMGHRFHQKYLPLLRDLGRYAFETARDQRTNESAKAFINGLNQDKFHFMKNNTGTDYMLHPYHFCPKHTAEVYNGPEAIKEQNNYYKTAEFEKLLSDVKIRAGIESTLTPTNVQGFYDLCRFFRAFSPVRRSPWCALFTDQELMIMEYLDDLKLYHRNGYASPINSRLAYLVLEDLFTTFKNTITGGPKQFTGYFSHDSILEMVYSALGLFKDYPGISGFERNPNRLWRSSFNAPFAGNFVAVLHKCSNTTHTEDHHVQVFINEVEFHLCRVRTCRWSEFTDKFDQFVKSNLSFCHENKTENVVTVRAVK